MTRAPARPRGGVIAVWVLSVVSALLGATATAASGALEGDPGAEADAHRFHEVQVLALNDFHGNLEPIPASRRSGRVNTTPAGGAAYLATHLRALRAQAARRGAGSVTVAAGDMVGGSPLLSAAFHDEPTVEAMNRMGLEMTSVGNHEFDEGWHELLRMQRGGCLDDGDGADNQNSCPDPDVPFPGAHFTYLAANVRRTDTGRTLLPPVEVRRYGGVRVGFIGMTLEKTPDLTIRSGVSGLEFDDVVHTANALVPGLRRQGVRAIVVLLHEGGFPADRSAYDSCPGISGPVVQVNEGLSPEIDAVITGHTHQGYNCSLPDPDGDPRLVTSASSFGRLVTEVRLTLDERSGDVVRGRTTATNHIVTRDVAQDHAIDALVARYRALVDPITGRAIGHLGSDSVTRTPDDSGESALGNLVADALRADPGAGVGGRPVDVAFVNLGGIRADLRSAPGTRGRVVTYGAAFDAQPFSNYVVAMDMTGRQILALLEQQWARGDGERPNLLQVSGIEYAYNSAAPVGAKVVAASVRIRGAPIDPAATYRVAANSFLADGGDVFSEFTRATDKDFGDLDIDALARYLGEHDPYTAGPLDRIDVP